MWNKLKNAGQKARHLAKGTPKRVTALVLCAAMMISMVPFVAPAWAAPGDGYNPVTFEDLYIREADKNTMDTYVQASLGGLIYLQERAIGNNGTLDGVSTPTVRNNYGTRFAGEVWADKSVFARYQSVIAEIRPFEADHVYSSSTEADELVKTVYYGYRIGTQFYEKNADGTFKNITADNAAIATASERNNLYTTGASRALQTLCYWLSGGSNTTSNNINDKIAEIDEKLFTDEDGELTSEAIGSVADLATLLNDGGTLTSAQASALNDAVNDAIDAWTKVVGHVYSYLGDGDFDGQKGELHLGADTDGITTTITMDEYTDFLHVYSLLSSTQQITGVTPLDVVMVLDVSGSMGTADINNAAGTWTGDDNVKMQDSIQAMNDVIDTLMSLNINNRVGVVLFSTRPAVLMELGHYEPIDAENGIYIQATSTPVGAAADAWYQYVITATGDTNLDGKYDDSKKTVVNTSYTSDNDGDFNTQQNKWDNIGFNTNMDSGFWVGLNMLAAAKETVVDVNGQQLSRIPSFIFLGDGDPQYMMQETGSTSGAAAGNGNWWNPVDPLHTSFARNASDFNNAQVIASTVMRAELMQLAVNKHYKQAALGGDGTDDDAANASDVKLGFYTIGISMGQNGHSAGREVANAILDPGATGTEVVNGVTYQKGFNAENNTYHPAGIGGGTTQVGGIYSADYPWSAWGIWSTWIGGQTSVNTTGRVAYGTNGNAIARNFNQFTNAQGNYDENYGMTINGPYGTLDVTVSKSEIMADTQDYDAAGNPIANSYHIDYTDQYFTAGDAGEDSIGNTLRSLIQEIATPTWAPVGGINAAGVSDFVSYADPIGRYMRVDDVTDITLFGHQYKVGVYKSGTYDEAAAAYLKDVGATSFSTNLNSEDKQKNTTYTTYWITEDVTGGGKIDLGTTTADYKVDRNGYLQNKDPKSRIRWNLSYAYVDLEGLGIDLSRVPNDFDGDLLTSEYLSPADRATLATEAAAVADNTFDLLSDIIIWVEDTGEWRDTGEGDFIVDGGFTEALYINISTDVIPVQIASVELASSESSPLGFTVYSYDTNLDSPVSSTPLRVFYNVSFDKEYLRYLAGYNAKSENARKYATGVALSAIASEYLDQNTGTNFSGHEGDRYTAFYSNYFTDTTYDDYPVVSDQTKRSRGNPTVTFSPEDDNQFYLFQKNRVLYLIPGSYGLTSRPSEIDMGDLANTYVGDDSKLYYRTEGTNDAPDVWKNAAGTEISVSGPTTADGKTTWSYTPNGESTPVTIRRVDPTNYIDLQDALNAFRANLDGKGTKSTYWYFGDVKPVDGSDIIDDIFDIIHKRIDEAGLTVKQAYDVQALYNDFQANLKVDYDDETVANDITRTRALRDEEGDYVYHQPEISSNNWYYIIREFYYPVSFNADGSAKETEVRYMAIARQGSEFGSGVAGGGDMGQFVEWYHPDATSGSNTSDFNQTPGTHYGYPGWEGSTRWWNETEKAFTFNYADYQSGRVPEDAPHSHAGSGWYVSARPYGLRVGGMANFAGVKGYDIREGVNEGSFEKSESTIDSSNVTRTAQTFFLPTVSPYRVEDDGNSNIIVNLYLGNNGRILVNDTILIVTKTVNTIGGGTGLEQQGQVFRFEIEIEGFYGERGAVIITRDEFAPDLWRRRFDTIDVRTDNRNLLLGDDDELALVNGEGKRVVEVEAVKIINGYVRNEAAENIRYTYFLAKKSANGEVIKYAKDDAEGLRVARTGEDDSAREYYLIKTDNDNKPIYVFEDKTAKDAFVAAHFDVGNNYQLMSDWTEDSVNGIVVPDVSSAGAIGEDALGKDPNGKDLVYYAYVGSNLRSGLYNDNVLRVFKADVVNNNGELDMARGDIYGNQSLRGGRNYYLTLEQYKTLDSETRGKGIAVLDKAVLVKLKNANDLDEVEGELLKQYEGKDPDELSEADGYGARFVFHIIDEATSTYVPGDREFWINKVYLIPITEVNEQDAKSERTKQTPDPEDDTDPWSWGSNYDPDKNDPNAPTGNTGYYENGHDQTYNPDTSDKTDYDGDGDWRTGYVEEAEDTAILDKHTDYKLLSQFKVAHIRAADALGATSATELASNNGYYLESAFLTTKVNFEPCTNTDHGHAANAYGHATFYLKDGQGYGFNNIDNGANYVVTEDLQPSQASQGIHFQQVDHVQDAGLRTRYDFIDDSLRNFTKAGEGAGDPDVNVKKSETGHAGHGAFDHGLGQNVYISESHIAYTQAEAKAAGHPWPTEAGPDFGYGPGNNIKRTEIDGGYSFTITDEGGGIVHYDELRNGVLYHYYWNDGGKTYPDEPIDVTANFSNVSEEGQVYRYTVVGDTSPYEEGIHYVNFLPNIVKLEFAPGLGGEIADEKGDGVYLGDYITYTIRWENYAYDTGAGQSVSAELIISDKLDPGLDFIEAVFNPRHGNLADVENGTDNFDGSKYLKEYTEISRLERRAASSKDEEDEKNYQELTDYWYRGNTVLERATDPGTGLVMASAVTAYYCANGNDEDGTNQALDGTPFDKIPVPGAADVRNQEIKVTIEYDPVAHQVKWTITDAPANTYGYVELKVQVNANATVSWDYEDDRFTPGEGDEYVVNRASVKVGDNPWQDTNRIENPTGDPHKTETDPGDGLQVMEGQLVEYSIDWTNTKDAPAKVVIEDRLDPGVYFYRAWIVGENANGFLNAEKTEEGKDGRGNRQVVQIVPDAKDPEEGKDRYERYKVPGTGRSGEDKQRSTLDTDALTARYAARYALAPRAAGDDYDEDGTGLTLTMTAKADTLTGLMAKGDKIGYTISWAWDDTVNGIPEGETVTSITVTDTLDPGVDFVSAGFGSVTNETASADGITVSYDAKTRTVTWTWEAGSGNALPADNQVTLTVEVNDEAGTVEGTGGTGMVVANRAEIEVLTEKTADSDPDEVITVKYTDETAAEETPVEAKPTVTSDRQTVKEGDEITYTISWNNYARGEDGKYVPANVTVTNLLDVGVDFVRAWLVYGDGAKTTLTQEGVGTVREPGKDPLVSQYSVTYDNSRTVTWELKDQAGGVGGTVYVTVRVNSKATKDFTYDGTGAGSATDNGVDNRLVNQAKIEAVPASGESETYSRLTDVLEVDAKTAPTMTSTPGNSILAGQDIAYTITWTDLAEGQVTVTDKLPDELVFIGAAFADPSMILVSADYSVENVVTWTYSDGSTIELRCTGYGGDNDEWPTDGSAPDLSLCSGVTVTWTLKNNDTSKGGAVTLSASVRAGTAAGTQVRNQATVTVGGNAELTNEKAVTVRVLETAQGEGYRYNDERDYNPDGVTGQQWLSTDQTNNGEPLTITMYDNLATDDDKKFVTVDVTIEYDPDNHIIRWTLTNVPAFHSGRVYFTVVVNERADYEWTDKELAPGTDKDDAGYNWPAYEEDYGEVPPDWDVDNTDYEIVNRARISIDDEPWQYTNIVQNPTRPEKAEINPGEGMTVTVGETITYTITWLNVALEADQEATVTITDRLDPGLTFKEAGIMYGGANGSRRKLEPGKETANCLMTVEEEKDEDGNVFVTVKWVFESPVPGTTGMVYLDVVVNENAVHKWYYDETTGELVEGTEGTYDDGGHVFNMASVEYGNGNTVHTDIIENPVDPGPEKTEPDPGHREPVEIGQTITYQVTWKNDAFLNGSYLDADVTIYDKLDPGVDYEIAGYGFVSGNGTPLEDQDDYDDCSVDYDENDHMVKWTLPKREARSSGAVWLKVTVNSKARIANTYNGEEFDDWGFNGGTNPDDMVYNQAYVDVTNGSKQFTDIVENPVPNPQTPQPGNPHKTEVTPGDGKTVKVGDDITYRIRWVNDATDAARTENIAATVTIIDKLDPGVDFKEASFGAVTLSASKHTNDAGNVIAETSGNIAIQYDRASHTVTWVLRNRGVQAYGDVDLVVTVNENAKKDWHYNKEKGNYEADWDIVEGDEDDWEVVNQARVTVTNGSDQLTEIPKNPLVPGPEKTETDPGDGKYVEVGREITYEITWINDAKDTSGAPAASKVTIIDKLDPGVDFVGAGFVVNGSKVANSWDGCTAVYDSKSHTVTWTLPAREAGVEGTVYLVVKVNENARYEADYQDGEIVEGEDEDWKVANQARVIVENGSNQLTEIPENPLNPGPKKTETNPGNGVGVKVGEEITYEITWVNDAKDNSGAPAAATVTIIDKLDPGVDFVGAGFVVDGSKVANSWDGCTAVYDSKSHTVTWTLPTREAETGGAVYLIVKVNENAKKDWHYNKDKGDYEADWDIVEGDDEDWKVVNQARVTVANGSDQLTEIPENPVVPGPKKTETNPGNGAEVKIGQEITYEITWVNDAKDDSGAPTASKVTIIDKLDPGVDFVGAGFMVNGSKVADSWDGCTVSYDRGSHTVTWTLPAREAEAEGTVYLVVKVNEKARQEAYYQDGEIVEGDGVDNMVYNQARVIVENGSDQFTEIPENPVVPGPRKTETDPGDGVEVKIGQEITYEITWENDAVDENGAPTASRVTIIDKLDPGVDYVSAGFRGTDGNNWTGCTVSYDKASHTVTWVLPNREAEAKGTVYLVVKVNENAKFTYDYNGKDGNDWAIEEGNGLDYEVRNQARVIVENGSDQLTDIPKNPVENPDKPRKTETDPGDGVEVKIGQEITYEITWKNDAFNRETGAPAASRVIIIDKLDPGVDYVSAGFTGDDGNGWAGCTVSYDKATHTVTWVLPNREAEAKGTVWLKVKVNENAKYTYEYNGKDADDWDIEKGDGTDNMVYNQARVIVENGSDQLTEIPQNPVTEPPEIPKTGDESHLGFWVTLLGLSVAGLLASLFYTSRKVRPDSARGKKRK